MKRDIIEMVAVCAFAYMAYLFLGIIGISEGSTDACSNHARSVMRAIIGLLR